MMNSSNRSGATAAVLAEFLPVLDRLHQLRETHGADSFGQQYNALAGAMKTAFTDLGVTDFAVAAGDNVDGVRVVGVATEHSDMVRKGAVVQPLRGGLELQGNVVRAAECVESLGPEGLLEAAHEEEESGTEESPPHKVTEDDCE